jgi:hypothetical protein
VPFEHFECAGRRYALEFTYAVPDDAWYIELSEAVPAPSAWADIPGAFSHLPGPALLVAVVPDQDPAREPMIHVNGKHAIPYEIVRWFMEKVGEEVERCRAA